MHCLGFLNLSPRSMGHVQLLLDHVFPDRIGVWHKPSMLTKYQAHLSPFYRDGCWKLGRDLQRKAVAKQEELLKLFPPHSVMGMCSMGIPVLPDLLLLEQRNLLDKAVPLLDQHPRQYPAWLRYFGVEIIEKALHSMFARRLTGNRLLLDPNLRSVTRRQRSPSRAGKDSILLDVLDRQSIIMSIQETNELNRAMQLYKRWTYKEQVGNPAHNAAKLIASEMKEGRKMVVLVPRFAHQELGRELISRGFSLSTI